MIEQEIQELRERDDLDEIRQELMARPNVHSTAIGYKTVDGEKTDEPAVFAYVDEKVSEDELSTREIIPKSVRDVPTDVQEADPDPSPDAGSSARRGDRFRPLVGGHDIQTSSGGWGTIALLVNDDQEGGNAAITAEHVTAPIGDPMYQPTENTNRSDNGKIGNVLRSDDSTNDDWAVVGLDDDTWLTNEVLGLGVIDTVEEPRFDSRIIVSSAKNGLIGGELWAIDIQGNNRTDYEYRMDEDEDMNGASGSLTLWYDSAAGSFKAFAMHTSSGSTNDYRKYGNDIQSLFDEANVSLDSGSYTLPSITSDPYFEGTIIDVDSPNREVVARVLNCGSSQDTRTVSVRDPSDGTTIDSTSVTLGELEYTDVRLSIEDYDTTVIFDAGDDARGVDIDRFIGDWRADGRLPDYGVQVNGVTADSDQQYVAVAPNDQYVDVYEYDTWNFVRTLDTGNANLSVVSSQGPVVNFSPDGNWLVVGMANSSGDGEASVFDVSSTDPSNWTYETGLVVAGGDARGVSFSPDSQFVGVADSISSPTASVWETGTWNHVTNLNTGTYGRSITFSLDGRYVAVGDSNGNATVFDVGDSAGNGWTSVIEFTDGSSTLGGMDWDKYTNYFVFGCWDNNAYVKGVGASDGTGWTDETTITMDGSVYKPTFSRDEAYLIVGEGAGSSPNANVEIYNQGDWSITESLGLAADAIESLFVDGKYLFVAARDGSVRIYRGPIGWLTKPSNLTASYA